jgi:hypothetical protein
MEDPGKWFVLDADPGECLVVFEGDIVMRLVFLDQVVLQQESILFRINYNVADISDPADQHLNLSTDGIDLYKIAANALLKVLCLSDVNDPVLIIKKLINPRLMRKRSDDSLQV